ncbi:Tyrosinase [Lachnellula hyalina]|uniref:Tyrosinase n=1 Tax=Lachnellula hyalina TaxID=1316788 RepID=A0A8H8R2A4_9HELO|nr:Tyrosinase [Lachnellula hyalina]TVY26376.1 Tyrosinase [Lachnellula hyalina]
MALPEYEDFFTRLEFDAHNAIPTFIRGDFYDITAPNDPVFYLHHTQLGRLWWKWQQRDLGNRVRKLSKHGHVENVHNVIDMGELAPKIVVRDTLDTLVDPLCYQY